MPEWFIWPYWLVPFIPVAIVLDFFVDASATLIFVTAALGVIPTAALMGVATEELASKSGPGLGGLLNVTFGNAPELIIALFALGAGLQEVVKASIVGAVLGNILLIMGIGMFLGGWKREKQTFNQTAVSSQALMLFLAVATLVLPAVFVLDQGKPSLRIVRVGYPLPDGTISVISGLVGGETVILSPPSSLISGH